MDLIDREQAIEVADAIWTVTGDNNVAKVWQQLQDLPSAEKTGKWINLALEPDNITGHTVGECSACGKRRIVDNYCPNCGAKMEVE